jgi:hypothetical protein
VGDYLFHAKFVLEPILMATSHYNLRTLDPWCTNFVISWEARGGPCSLYIRPWRPKGQKTSKWMKIWHGVFHGIVWTMFHGLPDIVLWPIKKR